MWWLRIQCLVSWPTTTMLISATYFQLPKTQNLPQNIERRQANIWRAIRQQRRQIRQHLCTFEGSITHLSIGQDVSCWTYDTGFQSGPFIHLARPCAKSQSGAAPLNRKPLLLSALHGAPESVEPYATAPVTGHFSKLSSTWTEAIDGV